MQRFTYPQECSGWAYAFNQHSGSMTVGKWIEPIMFGDLVFAAQAVEVTKLAFYQSTADYNGHGWQRPQLWGDNPLQVTLRNAGKQALTARLKVSVQDADNSLVRTSEAVVPAGSERTARVSIPIRGCGDQPFALCGARRGQRRAILSRVVFHARAALRRVRSFSRLCSRWSSRRRDPVHARSHARIAEQG